MAQIINEFLTNSEIKKKCEGCDVEKEEDVKDVKFLTLCASPNEPHIVSLCELCVYKIESLCECGNGGCPSGRLIFVLDDKGKEFDFDEFQ